MSKLSPEQRRFMRWLYTFCAPEGTIVRRVSGTIQGLAKRGLVVVDGHHVRFSERGAEVAKTTPWTNR